MNPFKKLILRRIITENISVLLLQYMGLMLTTLTLYPTPLWFASGTACAFIFMRGLSILPGIWLGSFIAYSLVKGPAFYAATIFTLQAAFLLMLTHRFIGPSLIFNRVKPLLKFILCSSIITAISSFLLSSSHFFLNWLANLNGVLIIGFGLITLDTYFPEVDVLKQKNRLILSLVFGLLLASTLANQLLLTLAFMLLIAIIYNWCGIITGLFLIGITLVFKQFFGFPINHLFQTIILLGIIAGSGYAVYTV